MKEGTTCLWTQRFLDPTQRICSISNSNQPNIYNCYFHFQIKEFDRVDSEDDILGEYREECKIGTGCLRKRTGLEKCCGGFIIVLLIVTLALIIALAQRRSGPGELTMAKTSGQFTDCLFGSVMCRYDYV